LTIWFISFPAGFKQLIYKNALKPAGAILSSGSMRQSHPGLAAGMLGKDHISLMLCGGIFSLTNHKAADFDRIRLFRNYSESPPNFGGQCLQR
jgi:hypothetical protein